MTHISYRTHSFRSSALTTIKRANEIIEDIVVQQGYVLTLRQLYYQFVSRNWIANTEREYKRLGRVVTAAREAGLISWTAIEDAGRNSYHFRDCPTAEQVLRGIEASLRVNPWHDQDHYVEVWVEKQALEGVVERPCSRLRTPYMACKGYLSASEAWRAGQRFERAIARGKRPVLLHLGDHDPSGIDMTRDNRDRLAMFARQGVEVRRLALNMDQIEEHGPPPNPAKLSDSRAEGYIAQHGEESWELDALAPAVIDGIISDAIRGYVDDERWSASMALEAERQRPLSELAGRWSEVERLVGMEGKPLSRLRAYEDNLDGPAMDRYSRAVYEAMKVVVQHDEANRAQLLELLDDAFFCLASASAQLEEAEQ